MQWAKVASLVVGDMETSCGTSSTNEIKEISKLDDRIQETLKDTFINYGVLKDVEFGVQESVIECRIKFPK